MAIKLKPQYFGVRIGFNNSAKPLGERNDLYKLVANARAKGPAGKQHLEMFEELPTPDELDLLLERDFQERRRNRKK